MKSAISIGLIGDYNAAVLAHQAIPRAIDLAGKLVRVSVDYEWVSTQEIETESRVTWSWRGTLFSSQHYFNRSARL
jgi:CTP synthase (UTP-ammonia lyase)